MGNSILETVLERLQEENFIAGAAYPGQKYPQIRNTMVAVHIAKVDRAALTVTMEVKVLCPATAGGKKCEEEAMRATEVLRMAGAVCVQNGCSYDGVSQVYVVPVLATFTCVTNGETVVMGPGFQVIINGTPLKYAVRFGGTEERDYKLEYAMGESAPAGISQGAYLWHIELEELFPFGAVTGKEFKENFEIKVYTLDQVETYSGCRWTSVKREISREGLRRTLKGFALLREVAA